MKRERSMKPKLEPERSKINGGVQVIIPDTVNQKMAAISALSDAVLELAKAINGVNVTVGITGCEIHAGKATAGIAIGKQ